MRLHHRVMSMQTAHNEISKAVVCAIEKYDLTYWEVLSCLNQVQAAWIKWAIRDERHPDDPEKRGGEE